MKRMQLDGVSKGPIVNSTITEKLKCSNEALNCCAF